MSQILPQKVLSKHVISDLSYNSSPKLKCEGLGQHSKTYFQETIISEEQDSTLLQRMNKIQSLTKGMHLENINPVIFRIIHITINNTRWGIRKRMVLCL